MNGGNIVCLEVEISSAVNATGTQGYLGGAADVADCVASQAKEESPTGTGTSKHNRSVFHFAITFICQ